MDQIWWKKSIIYHIYPRSFYDSNGDGIGDIQGIIQKLPYLVGLGIDAIWLSPIYRSPQTDFGYDVSDYMDIDPIFGQMSDFDELIELCHQNGIRLIMDLIMNHTSTQHPWFVESAASEQNPKRDWYIWQANTNTKPINNWMSAFGGSAWSLDKTTNSWYLHSFTPEQPDLNWRNKDMSQAYFDMVEFWLRKGVDGFRLDVVNMIVKDKSFRNNPLYFNIPFFQKHKYNRNRASTFEIIKKLRSIVDQYNERVLIGEVYVSPPGSPKIVRRFIKLGKKRLHLAFDFSIIFKRFTAKNYFKYLKKLSKKQSGIEWACHVFSNHDLGRSYNRFPLTFSKEKKAKMQAVFQFTIPGTPFVYYGEELGLSNAKVPKSYLQDPLGKKYWPIYSGRDQYRNPMPWTSGKHSGFTIDKPWLPIARVNASKNVQNQIHNPNSMWVLYNSLIELKKHKQALITGSLEFYIEGKNGILAYSRSDNHQSILVIINFNYTSRRIELPSDAIYDLVFGTSMQAQANIISHRIDCQGLSATILERRE